MSTLVQNIAKGKRKALIKSYEENKERVFFIAEKMDKANANKTTIWAFKNAWNDIKSTSKIKNDDFTALVVQKLANYLQRNSAKANKRDILNKCEQLNLEFSINNEQITVPTQIDQNIYDTIENISAPVENQDKTTRIALISVLSVVILSVSLMFILFSSNNKTEDSNLIGNDDVLSQNNNSEPATSAISAKLDPALTYYADIDIKDYGKITVKLDQDAAPITVANFVGLAQSGFYDNLTFHRIMEDFMMQGGDPNGNGSGGSKDNIYGEFKANGYENKLSHTRGAISMARSEAYNSASSQFFIVHEDSLFLDGKYAAFGYVTEGMDIVDTICESAKPTDDNGTIPSGSQPVINSIKIRTEQINNDSSEIES